MASTLYYDRKQVIGMNKFERWCIRFFYASHQPAVEQIIRIVHDMRRDLGNQMEAARSENFRRPLRRPADQTLDLDGGTTVSVTEVKRKGERLAISVRCRPGGFRALLKLCLKDESILDVGGLERNNNPRMTTFTFTVSGADSELQSEYERLPR